MYFVGLLCIDREFILDIYPHFNCTPLLFITAATALYVNERWKN